MCSLCKAPQIDRSRSPLIILETVFIYLGTTIECKCRLKRLEEEGKAQDQCSACAFPHSFAGRTTSKAGCWSQPPQVSLPRFHVSFPRGYYSRQLIQSPFSSLLPIPQAFSIRELLETNSSFSSSLSTSPPLFPTRPEVLRCRVINCKVPVKRSKDTRPEGSKGVEGSN